jgi:hypothetical protein
LGEIKTKIESVQRTSQRSFLQGFVPIGRVVLDEEHFKFRAVSKPVVYEEEFEDTKGLIRIPKSKKNRQHSGQKKKDKQRSTKHTHKTKDRITQTPLKAGGELRCSGRVSSLIFCLKYSFIFLYSQGCG